MRSLILAALVALPALNPTPANADAGGGAWTDEHGIVHMVEVDVGLPWGDDSGEGPPCTYYLMDYPSDATVPNVDGTFIEGDGTGLFYWWSCDVPEFGAFGVVYVRPYDPLELVDEARRYLPLPAPHPHFSPSGEQIVNLESWLWLDPTDWREHHSTVTVPGVSVTVLALPARAIWNLGDGSEVVCTGPGVAFDPSAPHARPTCAHTFRRSSARAASGAFSASVTLVWRAAWSATGAAGGGDLGTIELTTTVPLRVSEVQALNTRVHRGVRR